MYISLYVLYMVNIQFNIHAMYTIRVRGANGLGSVRNHFAFGAILNLTQTYYKILKTVPNG